LLRPNPTENTCPYTTYPPASTACPLVFHLPILITFNTPT
jgi:hypothetical protein